MSHYIKNSDFIKDLYLSYLNIPVGQLPSPLQMPDDLFIGDNNPNKEPCRHLFEDEFMFQLYDKKQLFIK